MATTLGVAVATRHVALVLIGQREAETVTLDEVLLDSDFSTTTPPADVYLQVLAEVTRISAVLDAHKRPLAQVAVAATEPAAARTAARVVEALTKAGVRNARAFAPRSSGRSLANRRAGNIALPSGLANGQSGDAAVTAAHEIAREALARDSDASGHAMSGRTRHAMALGATAVATICVGLIGFRALPAQSTPEVTPVEATDPVPTQVTHRADPPPTSAVNTEISPPAIVDTPTVDPTPVEQAEVAAPSTLAPTVAPTQNSPPTSVEPTTTPLEVVPPESPQAPEPPPVTASQALAEPPVLPPPSPPSTEPPPPAPAPAVPPSPEPVPPVPAAPQANPTPP